MTLSTKKASHSPNDLELKRVLEKYQKPDFKRSLWQVTNTIIPYFGLLYLMYLSIAVSYWVTLALSFLAAGFLIRIFIIFHDCGHGAFFKSRRASDLLGFITGVLTFTPYQSWRHEHAIHHATAGNLDSRGAGDIWTMTVQEYLDASFWKRLSYRLYRNPFVMFVIGPFYMFWVRYRIPIHLRNKRELHSVYYTDIALIAILVIMGLTIGLKTYFMIQLPIQMISGTAGVWLFYVQHQYEDVYWQRDENWDYQKVALEGSSFYKLPKILQWFTGNIGYHHVHHLSARIPNYYLEKCHNEHPVFQKVHAITFLSSLRTLRYRLWDEKHRKLIGFRQVKGLIEDGQKNSSHSAI